MFERRTPASNPNRFSPLNLLGGLRRRFAAPADGPLARAADAGVRSAYSRMVERLEERQLFTTLNPNDLFIYTDTRGNVMTITMGPDVTAEAIGATADAGGNVTLTNLSGTLNGVPVGVPGTQQDLYALYVTNSSLDSTISVLGANPFAGAPAGLIINSSTTGAPVTVTGDAGTGVGYLGARTPAGAPITSAAVNQVFGNLPGDLNPLTPGFYVDPGHNFGTFIFDGVVTGQVDVGGSMQAFYAGWILTGNTAGDRTGSVTVPNNFNVDGDIRYIVSRDSIGTNSTAGAGAPAYTTGFDLQVLGKVGQIATRDGFYGKIDAVNEINLTGLRTPYKELESFAGDPTLGAITSPFVVNDTPVTAQVLGSYLSTTPGEGHIVEVTGSLESDLGDTIDYYAVPMLAGQNLVVDLNSDSKGDVHTGIIDPDLRLVHSDYSNNRQDDVIESAISYHTDRPGIYIIAIATRSDNTFTGGGNPVGTVNYTLKITGQGELGVGAVTANSNIRDSFNNALANPEAGLRLERADFGAVVSGGDILSSNNRTIALDNGNLRALLGANIGTVTTTGTGLAPHLDIPQGSVGLVRAVTGSVSFYDSQDTSGDTIAIGHDIQVIDASNGTLFGQFVTNGGIGVIRAGNMATSTPSSIFVDFDGDGEDGFIDLIDVTANFGTILSGGPRIHTGLGGNVRYLRVGGEIFADDFFGGGQTTQIVYQPGEQATLTDDSGSTIKLSPLGEIIQNPDFDPINPDPGTFQFFGPHLTVTTYGVESGGVIVVDVTSTGGLDISGTGANAEVSRVEIQGVGRRVITQTEADLASNPLGQPVPTDEAPLDPLPGQTDPDNVLVLEGANAATPADDVGGDLALTMHGSSVVDVFDVVVVRTTAGLANPPEDTDNFPEPDDTHELGNATAITNTTRGEIVNVLAESVGFISTRGSIGIPRSHTGAAVEPIEELVLGNDLPITPVPRPPNQPRAVQPDPTVLISDIFPFLNQKVGIRLIGGSIIAARAGEAVGNFMVQGTIGSVQANTDHNDNPLVFEGIAGPIAAFNFIPDLETVELPGRILDVEIGEGLASSLAGSFSHAGIYAVGEIGTVRNQGLGSDIYGDIASEEGIRSISLKDGAIIDADIFVTDNIADTLETVPEDNVPTAPGDRDPITNPDFEIGSVTVTGKGGILGTEFLASDIGPISATGGGFGFVSNTVLVPSGGVIGGVTADGYGIRDSDLVGGEVVRNVVALGDGSSSSILNYTPSVRRSETLAIDPNTQVAPTILTDLHLALGVAPTINEEAGVTDTGIIQDVVAIASRDAGKISAYSIRATDPENNSTFFNFANSIGSVVTRGPINGLSLTTGRIGTFAPGGDVFNAFINFSGPVKSIHINGDFTENSVVVATGRNGKIKSMVVEGDLQGSVFSSGKLSSLVVKGNISGTVGAQNGGTRTTALGTLQFGGIAPGGTLTVNGNVTKIISLGNLGGAGQVLQVNGGVKSLLVRGNLAAVVNVTDSLKTLNVADSLFAAEVTVGNTINLLAVGRDVDENSIVTAKFIKRQQIRGQVFGQIVVTG